MPNGMFEPPWFFKTFFSILKSRGDVNFEMIGRRKKNLALIKEPPNREECVDFKMIGTAT
jgi:hypothetical protein